MREIFDIPGADVVPDLDAILARQGLTAGTRPTPRVTDLARSARELFLELARPRGLSEEITADEFAEILPGEGRNAPELPIAEIFPRAERLLLYIVTLGSEITNRIEALFSDRDFALASMLDAAASEGTERTERRVEQHHESAPARALTYSPGYCGWHVSGQKTLFARLRPADIGVTLRESFLMEPLKSISGVIVVGLAQIHDFRPRYPFCSECATRSCRERIADILEA
jgi:hypothetical protein